MSVTIIVDVTHRSLEPKRRFHSRGRVRTDKNYVRVFESDPFGAEHGIRVGDEINIFPGSGLKPSLFTVRRAQYMGDANLRLVVWATFDYWYDREVPEVDARHVSFVERLQSEGYELEAEASEEIRI